MELRKYQTPQVNKLIRQLTEHQVGALVSAVGTGKTIVTSIVGDELVKRGIVSKVIVAAPFNTIVKEFPTLSGQRFLNGTNNNGQYLIGKIEQADNIKAIINLISGCSSGFISTSHNAMASSKIRTAIGKIDDMSDTLLIIDEAHHCFASDEEEDDTDSDGTLLGELANTIKQKGGKLLYVTATPYRTFSGKTNLIFDPIECNPVIRTIGEQMRDGYAPSMETEYVHIKDLKLTNAGDAGIFGDLSNTKLYDPQLNILLPKIIKQWKAENYPKTILLVPAGNAEHTSLEVKKQLEAIVFPTKVSKARGRKNPSVLVAVGQSNTVIEYNGKEMNEIEYDKAVGGRAYDIVIGCRKFDEGTDVSSASHIFMVGLPSSVRLFHQRTGRVLRDRKNITGYSDWFGDQWMGKSKVVFFAPAGRKTKEFDFKVGRQLLHCIFAAESYQEYCESLNASQNIRIAFETKKDKCKDADSKKRIEEIMAEFSKIELTELKDYSEIEFNQLVNESLNPNMTVGERLELIKASDLSNDEKLVQYNNLLNHLPSTLKESFDWDTMINSILKESNKKTGGEKRFDVNPTEVISDVFESVLQEFYNEKISSVVESGVQKVFSEISGETMQEWAEKCSQFMGEEHAIKMCNKCIEYYNENGVYPPSSGNNVSNLGRWLVNMRKYKLGIGNGTFYQSVQKIADISGHSDMFEQIDRELIAKEMCMSVIGYYRTNNKYPAANDIDATTRTMGQWLNKTRRYKRGLDGGVFYESLQELANLADQRNMFDNNDWESHAITKCKAVIEYYTKNKKYPSQTSTDSYVEKLANWLNGVKMSKKGMSKKPFYPILQEIATEAGLPNMFDDHNYEQIAIDTCNKVIEYHRKHNQYPSASHTDINSRKLSSWLSKMRKSKRNPNAVGAWYPILQEIANSAGLSDMFTSIYDEDVAIDVCNKVIEYYNQHKKYPADTSNDVNVAKLGRWLAKKRRAKRGLDKMVFFQSLQTIADTNNLPNMFNSNWKDDICQ